MSRGRASQQSLSELHGALAKAFKDILENGQVIQDDEGVARMVTPNAAYFNAVRQFLKDNGIENLATAEQVGVVSAETLAKLPFTRTDEYGSH